METTGENKRPLNLFKYSNSIMTLNRCFVKTLSVNGNHDKLAKRGIISRSSCTSCVLFFFLFSLQDVRTYRRRDLVNFDIRICCATRK